MTPEKWRKAQDLFLAMMVSDDPKAILAAESEPVVVEEAQRLYNQHRIFEALVHLRELK
ncbi:MAG: hypothetical protein ABJF23_25845 [Bryobacteraceae bacterium]